jgi:ethanolamine ammonia-lyase small subunit
MKNIDEKTVKDIIQAILKNKDQVINSASVSEGFIDNDAILPDITTVDIKKQMLIESPHNREMYMRLKARTPARLGIGKAGPRYKTPVYLRIRADMAAAKDAVQTLVDPTFLEELGLPVVKSTPESKSEYLLRPDKGRVFDEKNTAILKDHLKQHPDVQIVIGDGLSSTAIEANVKEILPAIQQGLANHGIDAGTPVFVQYARVGSGDSVAEAVGAKLVIVLIGERPGVASSESMSCYMTYNPKVGMMESGRSVISNIHRNGTPPAEAGAHIADLVATMLREKKSGVALTVNAQDNPSVCTSVQEELL